MDFDLRAEAIVTTYIEEHLDKTDGVPDFEVFTARCSMVCTMN